MTRHKFAVNGNVISLLSNAQRIEDEKPRGAPIRKGHKFFLELRGAVKLAQAVIAHAKNTPLAAAKDIPVAKALRQLDRDFLARWNLGAQWECDRETLVRTLEIRHSEMMRARRCGLEYAKKARAIAEFLDRCDD